VTGVALKEAAVSVTVMCAVPAATAITSPTPLTVAMAVLSESNVSPELRVAVVALL
jgi:hypothetical protein